jgi:hypothetical protein
MTASCRPLMGLLQECLPGFYIELYQKQDSNYAYWGCILCQCCNIKDE